MATEHGILQALWGELRLAVEARSEDLVRPCVALMNRRKTEAALAKLADILAQPAVREHEVLAALSSRALGKELSPSTEGSAARAQLWRALSALAPERWANARLFLDDPLVDRVWLFRRGSWVLYGWDGARFSGSSLGQVREWVRAGRLSAADAMLTVRVAGETFLNPKLPPEGDAPNP